MHLTYAEKRNNISYDTYYSQHVRGTLHGSSTCNARFTVWLVWGAAGAYLVNMTVFMARP